MTPIKALIAIRKILEDYKNDPEPSEFLTLVEIERIAKKCRLSLNDYGYDYKKHKIGNIL